MAIYDQSYQPWAGATQSRLRRILSLTASGLRLPFQSLLVRLTVILMYFLMAVWLFILYLIASNPNAPPLALGNNIYRTFFFNSELFSTLIVIFTAAVGSSLVSRDLRYNALLFYFSKAVTRADYLIAKYLTIVGLLLTVTLGPALMLFVGQILMGMEKTTWTSKFNDLSAIASHSLIIAMPMGAAILGLSALSKRGYIAGILWAVIYFTSMAVSGILQNTVREEWCKLVSWHNLTSHLGNFVYEIRPVKVSIPLFGDQMQSAPQVMLLKPWPCFTILAAITVIGLSWVRFRVRSVEGGE